MSNPPRRYAADEVAIPPGFLAEDMDWVAFSWDLKAQNVFDPDLILSMQFVLAPGVFLYRERKDSEYGNLFDMDASHPGECQRREPGEPGITASALAETMVESVLNNLAWKTSWVRKPFLVNFNDAPDGTSLSKKDLVGSPVSAFGIEAVATLGNVVAYAREETLVKIFNRVAQVRAETS